MLPADCTGVPDIAQTCHPWPLCCPPGFMSWGEDLTLTQTEPLKLSHRARFAESFRRDSCFQVVQYSIIYGLLLAPKCPENTLHLIYSLNSSHIKAFSRSAGTLHSCPFLGLRHMLSQLARIDLSAQTVAFLGLTVQAVSRHCFDVSRKRMRIYGSIGIFRLKRGKVHGNGLGHQVNILAWIVHLIVTNESQGS